MSKHVKLIRGIFIAALCLMVLLSILGVHETRYAPNFSQDAILSRPSVTVDKLIEKLADHDLDRLHGTGEAAISFTYLSAGPLVYSDTVAMMLALILLLMMAAHTLLNLSKHMILQTGRAAEIILLSLVFTAGITWACDSLFRCIAIPAGAIDIHIAGTGLAALSMTALTAYLATHRTNLTYRDLNRAFAYLHGLLGAAVTVLLPGAGYLFVFSGLMLMGIQLLITFHRPAMDWGAELLATALYMPIIMPILALTASTWAFGLIFALGIFPVGISIAPLVEKITLHPFTRPQFQPLTDE